MSPTLFIVLLAAGAAAPAPAEESIKPPQGPPPLTIVASVTKEGDVEIVQTAIEYRAEQRTREVTDNAGRKVSVTYTVTVPVMVQKTQRLKGDSVKVYTAAGKEVDARDVPEKLKKPAIVLLAANGEKVDPFYLQVIKPDTLVIVPPKPPVLTPQVPKR